VRNLVVCVQLGYTEECVRNVVVCAQLGCKEKHVRNLVIQKNVCATWLSARN